MIKKNFALQILISTIITFFIAIYPLTNYFSEDIIISVLLGCVISLINVFIGYELIKFSINKPNKVFFKITIGSIGIRIIFIGLSIFILIKFFNVNTFGLVISLFFYYFLYMIIEIMYINKKLLTKNVKQI